MPYRARTAQTLLEALEQIFEGRSRKDLRRLLADERVRVNDAVATDPRLPLLEGDAVDCVRFGRPLELHPRVRLVHEDDHLLVVDKGAGILTAGGTPGLEPTVADVLEKHLRQRGVRGKAFPCHRLDRGVSGLCAFARRADVAQQVRDAAARHLKERVYHALVEGVPSPPSGTIRSHLQDDDRSLVVREVAAGEGKLAVTRYRVLEAGPRHATVEVRLETGRKNQIRVHLASIGHPVAGDRKYGARTDPARRIALHAARLTVVHPLTGEVLELRSEVPGAFARPPAQNR
jgi:23S rRNA pseudouridine1911/1915/1917 synthase